MPSQHAPTSCGESHKEQEQRACLHSPQGDLGATQAESEAANPTPHAPLHGARDGGARADSGHREESAQRDAASQEPAEADEPRERQIGTLLELILELRVELLGFQGSPS